MPNPVAGFAPNNPVPPNALVALLVVGCDPKIPPPLVPVPVVPPPNAPVVPPPKVGVPVVPNPPNPEAGVVLWPPKILLPVVAALFGVVPNPPEENLLSEYTSREHMCHVPNPVVAGAVVLPAPPRPPNIGLDCC